MMRSRTIQQMLSILISLILIVLTLTSISFADVKPSTLTGRVVDENGVPVANLAVILLYVKLREYGGLDLLYDKTLYPFLRQDPKQMREHLKKPLPDEQTLRERPPYQESIMDTEGNFIFTGIVPGIIQLMVLPNKQFEQLVPPADPMEQMRNPLPEIRAIKFGKVLFYPHPFPMSAYTGAVTFAIKPGAKIQDVEIIMKSGAIKQQQIKGRIVFKNGTPLADKSVTLTVDRLDIDGTNGSVTRSLLQTDPDGNFIIFIGGPGIFSLTVTRNGLLSMSDLFIVKDRQTYQGLVLTLDGDPSDVTKPESDNTNSEDRNNNTYEFMSFDDLDHFPDVWIINPENGHAYKAVQCDGTRKDAEDKAKAEGSQLVTITSEAEQVWLDVVYKDMRYWIGLKYDVKDSRWEWDTGELFSHSNWNFSDISTPGFPVPDGSEGSTKDSVIMSSEGKWERIDSAGEFGKRTLIAVIEKDASDAKDDAED